MNTAVGRAGAVDLGGTGIEGGSKRKPGTH